MYPLNGLFSTVHVSNPTIMAHHIDMCEFQFENMTLFLDSNGVMY